MVPPREPPKPSEWRPDRIALKVLGCGHRAEIIPVVQDVFSLKAVWCPHCGDWVAPPVKKQRKEVTNVPAQQEEFPPF